MIELRRLGFTALDTNSALLKEINLTIHPGEHIGLIGPSGCGKSTLCYHLAGIHTEILIGRTSGQIRINDWPAQETSDFKAGMVLQNPESQLFASTVLEEISYGLRENSRTIVSNALSQVQLEGLEDQTIASLSLGQKQRLVIASFLALQPDLLILDEPTNSLDQSAADHIFEITRKVSTTVIMVEHDLDRIIQWADRIIEMEQGTIILDEPVSRWLQKTHKPPRIFQIAKQIGGPSAGDIPTDRHQLVQWFARFKPSASSLPRTENNRPCLVQFTHVTCAYQKSKPVLNDISLKVNRGECLVLLGLNGSGKTTLLKHICALLKPRSGDISIKNATIAGRKPEDLFGLVGYVFQNPDYQIFDTTVARECGFCLRNHRYDNAVIDARVDKWLNIFHLDYLKQRSPLTLSFGEKRRLTLASVLVAEPEIIVLDEPTTALDDQNITVLYELLRELVNSHQKTLLIATHDIDFALDIADRIIFLGDNQLRADVPITQIREEIFNQNGFHLTFTGRLILASGLSEYPAGCKRLEAILSGD
jgi:energy-coupling factor transporter ATP-binding protein EcfA2